MDLTRDSPVERWQQLQRDLATLGHPPGPIDGLPGPLTFRAIDAFLSTLHGDVARYMSVPGWLVDAIHLRAAPAAGLVLTDGASDDQLAGGVPSSTSAIVGGVDRTPPEGVRWRNWRDDEVKKLRGKGSHQKRTIVVHESVTSKGFGRGGVIDVLTRRHLGVQLVVHRNGEVSQHADLLASSPHAGGGKNTGSVGLELVSPYYGSRATADDTVIDARWAHKGRYITLSLEQLESCWIVAQWLAEQLVIPLTWPGIAVDDKFVWGRKKGAYAPGLVAHCRWHHSDGLYAEHFMLCRHRGYSPEDAVTQTMAAAQKGGRGVVTTDHWR